MSAVIVIMGEPQGKARPRLGRGGHTYTPQKTKDYEALVAWSYRSQGGKFYDGSKPLRVEIYAYYPIPKSVSKKKLADMIEGRLRPTVKPDIDNVTKIIYDALGKGVAYDDDKIIVESFQRKLYSQEPRVVVHIEEVSQ